MRRRDFLKNAAELGAAVGIGHLLRDLPAALADGGDEGKSNAPGLAQRPYGKTGRKLSVIGMGGIVVMRSEQEHANRVVAEFVEKGVNYFDVAPTYGNAEQRLGPALEPYRKKCFLACKTTKRQRGPAEVELKQSLKNLRTDHFDLYQLHAINKVDKDVDAAFAKDGVMGLLIEARKAGLIRHIGFSAHSVEAALAAFDRYDFDSVLVPVNFACCHKGDFGPQIIRKAQQKNAAVLALKATARDRWPAKKPPMRAKYPKCWYRPLVEPAEVALALRFTLSLPVTAAVPPGEEAPFRWALEAAMKFKPLTDAEHKQVAAWAATIAKPLFTYEPPKKPKA